MNHSRTLKSVRQTAVLFASLCCTAAALAIATPVLAADAAIQIQPQSAARIQSVQQPVQAAPVEAIPTAAPTAEDSIEEQLRSADLKPGDFIWRDGHSGLTGPVRLLVSISDQRAYLYRADTLVAVSTVSTGRSGHRTPTGTFPITEKRAVHFSNKYNNAPMPHMQRLTNDGIALHAGHIPGHPASHGCVRLPSEFAAALFKVTRRGTPVTITL